MCSHTHICETPVYGLDFLVFFYILAERTMAELHVGELILIKHEELVAVLTLVDRHVWHHVLEVPLRISWTQMAHVNDEYFLKPDVAKNVISHWHGPEILRLVLLVDELQHARREQVIFERVVGVKVHRLFSAIVILFPLIAACTSSLRSLALYIL